MVQSDQNFTNHKRLIPAWHYFALPVLLINVFVAAFRMSENSFSKGSIWDMVVAIALLLVVWYSRTMPLTAQDRVIRLEERIRLREKLPSDLHGQINDMTPGQMIGLRFASDEELPDLARRCITGELKTGGEVKKAIRTWRPDTLRV